MSYEELGAHAQEIVEKATKAYMEERGYVERSPGEYYDPSPPTYTDPPSYQSPSTGGYSQQTDTNPVQTAVDAASGLFADIPDLFAPLTSMPDPGDFDATIADFEAAQGRLSAGAAGNDPATSVGYPANTILDGMDTSQDYLARWTGIAASQFKSEFADKFESITVNQFLAAGAVKGALQAEKSIWDAARKNADKIAEDTIKALEHMNDCGKNEWGMAFTVAGAVVAMAAIPFTGGASVVAFTAIGGALSIGGAAVGNMPDPPELDMSGETAEAVVSSMRKAITQLKDEIRTAEQKVADKMTELDGILTNQKDSFVSPRPDLASSGPHDIEDDMGVAR